MAKRDIKQKHNKNIPGPSKRCQLNPKGWNHLAPLWRCWYDAIWANYEKNPRDSIYFSPPLAVTVPNQRFGHAVFFPEWCGPTSPLVATCKSLPIYSKQLTALKSHNSRFNKNKHLEMVKCCVSISFKPNNKLKKFTELKKGVHHFLFLQLLLSQNCPHSQMGLAGRAPTVDCQLVVGCPGWHANIDIDKYVHQKQYTIPIGSM